MVELLVVIIILALLIALLLPAIQGAVRTAREARVVAETNSMAQALADFKSQYGDYPPSRLVICENGDYSGLTGTAAGLRTRTMAALRKFWPRVVLKSQAAAPDVFTKDQIDSGLVYDVNGNGVCDGAYILEGHQCLVLFLGGIPQVTSTANGIASYGVTGFSKNPNNPFQTANTNPNRYPPKYEFANERLIWTDNDGDLDHFPGYIDSLGSYDDQPPYFTYFSAYNGSGYDPDDVNFTELDSNGTSKMLGAFATNNSANMAYVTGTNYISSPAPNPYLNDLPVATQNGGDVDTTAVIANKQRIYQNPNSFQIISPGQDRLYGIGGQYNPKIVGGGDKLPWLQSEGTGTPPANSGQAAKANETVTKTSLSGDARQRENDNLTNFATGRLN